jgi:hypothetical protein
VSPTYTCSSSLGDTKPHERYSVRNYHVYRTDRHPSLKGGSAVVVEGVSHTLIDLPPVHTNCKKQVLLAAVYKIPSRAWSDADVIELLNFRNKSILAGYLNAKNTVWNS